MKFLFVILFIFLFLFLLYYFSSYTAFFLKIDSNQTEDFYFVGKVRIEKGKIANVNFSLNTS
ncbi:MAG: hypothetical protein QW609_01845 [Candidatus Aenigmatarchaeota archaeon]